ncbi:unnamed protein product [Alopecurus aequalis]
MASPALLVFLVLPGIILAVASPNSETSPSIQYCDCPCRNETNLHLYLHQFVGGDNHPNRNEDIVLESGRNFGFGMIIVHDWILTSTTNPSDIVVARVEGVHVQSGRTKANQWYTSQNIVFEQGRFAGSTLQVMGLSAPIPQGEWSIVGGTGVFRMAQGTIKFKEAGNPPSTSEDDVKELDINVFYTPSTSPAAAGTNLLLPRE